MRVGGFSYGLPITIPILLISLSLLSTSIGLFSYGGWKYFTDNKIEENRDLFIGSVVCISLSYLINLIPCIVSLAIGNPQFRTPKVKDIKLNKEKKYKLLEKLMLDLKIENNNDVSFIIGYRL